MITLEHIRAELEKKLQIDHMLRFVEVHADTIDDALADAAVQLETPVRHLEYEVVERGSDGFMGMAKKPWCIRVYPSAASLQARKNRESSASDAFEDDMEPVIADRDGEAFVRFFSGQIYLKIIHPVANGKPASLADILGKLNRSDVITFDEEKIKKLLKAGTQNEYEAIGFFTNAQAGDSTFTVDISSDEMVVTITASAPAPGGSEINAEKIERVLTQQGVVAGISKEKISAFVDEPKYNEPYIVAEGIKPQDGRDAYIAYNFETDTSKMRLKESASDQVDFKELNLIQNVVEGQPLAQKMLPERGKAGKTVRGRYLEARNGKDIAIPLGKNVALDSDGRTILAQKNGQVLLIGNKICVEPIMQVDGDVGIKTGNITFLGTVVVKGNVDDGFNIKASGNIEIYGTVGKCNVEADGDVIVSLGIMGRDEGVVRAGKSLWAKFIQNAKVDVEEIIVVTDGIINSNVTSNKKIIVQGKRGAIIGGHIFATEEINCKNIGSNGGGSETILEVGFDPRSKLRLDELNSKQASLVQELEEISLNIATLENTKKLRRQLPPDKEENLVNLVKRKNEIIDETEAISVEIQSIQAYLRDLKVLGKVSASGSVYPGVKLYIRDTKEEIRNEIKKVTFYLDNGFVRQGNYEPPADDVKRAPDGYTAD